MHELYGKFALSLLEGTRIDNSGQSGIFTALKFCCPSVYCSLHSRCRTGKGDWQEGKKRDASFTLRVGCSRGREKGSV